MMGTTIRANRGAGRDGRISRRALLLAFGAAGCGGRSWEDGGDVRSIENKLVNIPLGTGMNEAGGQRSGTIALYQCTNARVRSAGQLQKRCGTTTITGTTNTPSGTEHGLCRDMDELPCFVTSLNGLVVSGTTAGDAFGFNGTSQDFRGCFSSVLPVRSYAMNGGGDAYSDVDTSPVIAATSDGYIATAYTSQDSLLRISVRGPDGNVVYKASAIARSTLFNSTIRIVAVGSKFYVLWNNTNVNIKARELTISGGTCTQTGGDTTIATIVADTTWDASNYDGTNWYLTRYRAANSVRTSIMTGLTEGTTADIAVVATALSIWADPVTQRVWIGIFSLTDGEHKFAIYSSALGVVLGLTSINAAFFTAHDVYSSPPVFGPRYSPTAPTDVLCVLSFLDGTPSTRRMHSFTISASGTVSVDSPNFVANNLRPVSKPDDKQRIWCRTEAYNGAPGRFMLLRLADAGLATANVGAGSQVIELATAEILPAGNFGDRPGKNFHAIATLPGDGLAFVLPIVVTNQTNSSGATEATIQAHIFEYSEEAHRQVVPDQSHLAIAGQPTELLRANEQYLYSSAGCLEFGFAVAPEIISATASPAGSGLAPGVYAYQAVLQWPDSLGRRQLSAVSDPIEVTVAVTSTVGINVSFPSVGQRPPSYITGVPGPTVLLYRTTAGGQNYQLLPLQAFLATTGAVFFSDDVSDAVLSENEFIYTDGGVLPNKLAPSCRFLCSAEERLWCGGLWDPTVLEASKVRVPGEPTNFTGHPSHQVVLPEECTGLAYMDGQVVAFAQDAIYLVGGDGPNDQGAGTFLPPRLMTRGIGCVDYRSLLETPLGILFMSRVGIYLLPRGFGAPQYIGAAVQDTVTNYPTVLAAAFTVTDEFNLARWLLADTEGGTHGTQALTLDIDNGQWFLDTYNAGLDGFGQVGAGDEGLLLIRSDLVLTSSGITVNPIWEENETAIIDAGAEDAARSSSIARTVQTTWIYPFGPGGWGRVNKSVMAMDSSYPSGILTDTCGISLTVETDDTGTTETKSWTVAGSAGVAYRGFDLTRRDCTAFRGTITESDAIPTGASRGAKWTSLTFEIGEAGGIRMLTSSER
jgi:hypothetical protein